MNLTNGNIYYNKEYKQIIIITDSCKRGVSSIRQKSTYTGKLESIYIYDDIIKKIRDNELVYMGNIHALLDAMVEVFDALPET